MNNPFKPQNDEEKKPRNLGAATIHHSVYVGIKHDTVEALTKLMLHTGLVVTAGICTVVLVDTGADRIIRGTFNCLPAYLEGQIDTISKLKKAE